MLTRPIDISAQTESSRVNLERVSRSSRSACTPELLHPHRATIHDFVPNSVDEQTLLRDPSSTCLGPPPSPSSLLPYREKPRISKMQHCRSLATHWQTYYRKRQVARHVPPRPTIKTCHVPRQEAEGED